MFAGQIHAPLFLSTERVGNPRRLDTTPASSVITHGSQITTANTGYLAYFDPTLGRLVTDADMTVHTGVVSASDFVAAGGTIKRHYFQGGLNIDIDNVTLVACRFEGAIAGYYSGIHHPFTVNWCTTDTSGAAGDEGIRYQDYTAYRCRIGGGSDGGKINGNCSVTECYITTKSQSSADHNDGLQAVGSYTGGSVVRCHIDCRPVNGSGGANSAIQIADTSAGTWTLTDNWMAGGGYVIRCYENCSYNVTGTKVLDASWIYGAADRQVIPQSQILTWSNNTTVDGSGNFVATIAEP